MTGLSSIDLSRLPAPELVELLDHATLVEQLKDDFRQRAPEQAAVLDLPSEPLVKLMETFAYRELILRQHINDAGRSVMLAYASGHNLEHLAALFGIERRLVTAADPAAHPPVAAVPEDDAALRKRIQESIEGYSTAGPAAAYRYWTLSVDPAIIDVAVSTPEAGTVQITVLTNANPKDELTILAEVRLKLAKKRPLCDTIQVDPAT